MNRQNKSLPFIGLLVITISLALFFFRKPAKIPAPPFDVQTRSSEMRSEVLKPEFEAIRSLFKNFISYEQVDYSGKYNDGQSFAEYVASSPTQPSTKKKIIYVLLIGEFSKDQLSILDSTLEYMEASFGLPVKKLASYPMKRIPLSARRRHPEFMFEQLNAKYIIKDILMPNRPEDAMALIGFTATDLHKNDHWNYVFGLASKSQRIGVWSLYRNGDPEKGPNHYLQCLKRTIATAVHETGHIFGIEHCITYECLMSDRHNIEEADSRGLHLCPQCYQKLIWNTGDTIVQRTRRLISVTDKIGLKKEKQFFMKTLELLKENRVNNK